ncbi:hypothetical protein K7X08_010236 [Anisodus acutangulus]|uniref:Uncharacterized protein n=1 Tax=Anisodus acutangulus TaxID=402998 RepID=A0A9Q1RRJ3_9SOLA|nr:hypothetical protein K7X08_010236 [Anisodus acutangulus]
MGEERNLNADIPHQVVTSSTPREDAGMYWGYKVRYAPNISSVFKNCPYKGGYDHLIGTSEHGVVMKSSDLTFPSFRGKVRRRYLNTCPHQGSRTIRTEEAIFISLQYLQEPVKGVLQKI